MRNIYVPLPELAVERLRELAERELRDTKQQAAILILDGLEMAGVYDRTPIRHPAGDAGEVAELAR